MQPPSDNPAGASTSSSSVPPKTKKPEQQQPAQPVQEQPVQVMEKHRMPAPEAPEAHEEKNIYLPFWMPILAFLLIIAAYLYCYAADIQVNPLYRIGAIGISGFFAAACAYLRYAKE